MGSGDAARQSGTAVCLLTTLPLLTNSEHFMTGGGSGIEQILVLRVMQLSQPFQLSPTVEQLNLKYVSKALSCEFRVTTLTYSICS